MKFLHFLLICGLFVSCGKDEEDSQVESISSVDEIYGLWEITEYKFENSDNKISRSGAQHLRFRKNGTRIASYVNVSMSFGGVDQYKNCSMSSSGDFEFNDGKVVYSDGLIFVIEGECGMESIGSTQESSTTSFFKDGENLRIEEEFSYNDKGISKTDKIIVILKKTGEEKEILDNFDGNLIGEWEADHAAIEVLDCSYDKNGSGSTSPSGSKVITIESFSKISSVEDKYSLGGSVSKACSGSDVRKMNVIDSLNMSFEQVSYEGEECMEIITEDIEIHRSRMYEINGYIYYSRSATVKNEDCTDSSESVIVNHRLKKKK